MKKQSKKVLSILCVVALLLSVVNVGFFITASSGIQNNDAFSTGSDNKYSSNNELGVNALASSSIAATYTVGGEFKGTVAAQSWTPVSKMIDGDPNNSVCYITDAKWVSGAYTPVESTYIDVNFRLSTSIISAKKFLVAHNVTNSNGGVAGKDDLPLRHYEVYAAKTEEELKTATPIITWNNSDTKREQIFDISEKNLAGTQYIRVRFYDLKNGTTIKPAEIGLYGVKSEFEVKTSFTSGEDKDYSNEYGANRLSGTILDYSVNKSGASFTHAPKADILTDNKSDVSNQIQINGGPIGSGAGDYSQTAQYVELKFTLPSILNNPSSFMIAFRDAENATCQHYSIFASASETDLFNAPIFTHSSSSNDGQEHHLDIASKNLTGIKHFAIRLYNMPQFGTINVISEIALYGGTSLFTAQGAYTSDENKSYAAYGDNKLSSAVVEYSIVDTGNPEQTWSGNSQNPTTNSSIQKGLVDNTSGSIPHIQPSNAIGSKTNYTQTDEYIQITYDLNNYLTNPEKFMLAFRKPGEGSQHYAFYAAEKKEDLFDKSVYEFSASSVAGQHEHHYDLSSFNIGKIRYFAIRFYHLNEGAYLLLHEVALYGGKAELTTSATLTTDKNDCYDEVYGPNMLSGASMTYSVVDPNEENSFGSHIPEADILTDGYTTSRNQIQTKLGIGQTGNTTQTDEYVQIEFAFANDINEINKFLIAFDNASNIGTKDQTGPSMHYAIFASNSKDTLYNNSLFEFKSSARTGAEHTIDLSGRDLSGIKYFAVRFYEMSLWSSCITPSEIGLYGEDLVHSIREKHDKSLVAQYGVNHFATAEGSIKATNGSSTVEIYHPLLLTDDTFTENTISAEGILNMDTNSVDQTSAYIEITEKLSGYIDRPEKLVIAFHEDDNANISSKHYAVFASDKLETLYNDSNQLFDYKAGDKLGVENLHYIFGRNLKGIRYFGIRLYHRGSIEPKKDANGNDVKDANGNIVYVPNGEGQHLAEIGLFGGVFTKDSAIESIETSGTIDGENLLANSNVFANYYINDTYQNDVNVDLTKLVDGKEDEAVIINDASMPQDDTTLGNGTDGKGNYYTLDFYLKHNTNIDAVRIVNADKSDNRTYRYELYASTYIGDLYNRNNLLFQGHTEDGIVNGSYINNSGIFNSAEQVQIFNFKEGAAFGKYFGIKVYETGKGASVSQVELLEVELFGTQEPYAVTSGVHYTESEYNALGVTLLAGKNAFRIRNNGTVQSTYVDDTKPMTDGKFGTNMAISEYKDDGAYDIMYVIDPDVPYTINKFFLSGIANPKNWNEQWFTAKYEVYAAIELDDIFLPENKVYDYDFERDGLSRYQIVNFDKEINACYIAIRVIDSTAYNEDQVGVRFEEFGLYGEKADIDYQPTNLASYLPVSAYLTDANGKTEAVSDKDFTVKENIYISDSDASTVADFTTDGKTLDLIFNLCNDAELNAIKVLAESSKLSYNVYAALDIGKVWDDSSLIATYNGSDTPFSVGEDEELLTTRYIRISFAGTNGKKVTVKDIQAIGLENQLLKHKAISRTLDGNKASVFTRDLKTNELTYDNFKDGGTLFDADYYGAAMTYVGVQGESTANVLVNLNGLKNVDEISVYFTRHMIRNHPLELKIYMSNTYDGAMDFSAEPVATFTGLPKEAKYTIRFKPELARYIRIEVTKNNWDEKTGEGDFINEKNMVLAFSEIEVFGTSVVGMQTDYDRDDIMSFTDKDTGITWEIIRVDESDIITSVYSSKLVTYKASNWQKTSLNQSPYFKVVDDKVYGFEFFDFFGNQVKSIEGRELRVKFPVSEELLGGASALGNATNPKAIEVVESNDGDGMVYTSFVYTADSKMAVLQATDADDEYWSTIGELENFPGDEETKDDTSDNDSDSDFDLDLDDGSDFLGDEEVNDGTVTPTSKTKITKTISTTTPPLWLFIVDGLLVLLFLASITTIIVIGVKRRKNR